ncbi:hypothetical protein BJX61DRAFT_529906 [Aspergillus egyptiacus]|nr:hypothetical protein BJX61DRAFT_529906 [Aspergillus egyptiacus]
MEGLLLACLPCLHCTFVTAGLWFEVYLTDELERCRQLVIFDPTGLVGLEISIHPSINRPVYSSAVSNIPSKSTSRSCETQTTASASPALLGDIHVLGSPDPTRPTGLHIQRPNWSGWPGDFQRGWMRLTIFSCQCRCSKDSPV